MINLARENIKDLEAYCVEMPHYEILANANENPYDFPMNLKRKFCDEICNTHLNRYPDACFTKLLEALSEYTGVSQDGIICGSGSDELIAMIHQAFVNPEDVIVSHSPSFAMYHIWANIANAKHLRIEDDANHRVNSDQMILSACEHQAKILYLCNPNNPTGYIFSREEILNVLDQVPSLVVLDEAYIEFGAESSLDLLEKYPRLLILRTLSKAFGLAGIRCGYALGNPEIIRFLYKVKGPYNLNVLTQKLAVIALENRQAILKNLAVLKDEREKVMACLKSLKVFKLYPSGANFVFFESPLAPKIYEALLHHKILIKQFKETSRHPKSIRFSIGQPQENKKILEIIKEVVYNEA